VHLHILGICGTFMGGLAAIAREAGHRVSGCDANVYPPMSEQLAALGIELIEGYGEEQLALHADQWVVGNVISRGNPLAEALLDQGARLQSGPQWLSDHILSGKRVLAVAGTHGKTSTSAMLAWILECAGRSPGFLIGGVPTNFPASARLSASDHFVIEADEYDTAFFDKRSKFVHYWPRTAVINNIEFDHADIFSDLAEIEHQFHHFVRTVPRSGRIIVNGRDESIKRVLTFGSWASREEFGVASGWSAGSPDARGGFDVALQGKVLGHLDWGLTGEHDRMNALAAIAAARDAGVEPAVAFEALGSYRGVRRRMEWLGSANGIAVYDDFAHHPTAIRATLQGLRARVGNGRIHAVLEPRSNTMRLGTMKEALPPSLAGADFVYLYTTQLQWDAAAVFRAAGRAVHCDADLESLVRAIARRARAGDHVLVMSNGAFGGIHAKLLARLAARPDPDQGA